MSFPLVRGVLDISHNKDVMNRGMLRSMINFINEFVLIERSTVKLSANFDII